MKTTSIFWHRTPPALFPCLLGFIGLGLAWRRAADIWPVPSWIGEAVLVAACALFAFTFGCYLMKLCLRPSVIFDEMTANPARGAVSAGSMCLMIMAGVIAPYSIGAAQVFWWGGILVHHMYMWCVIRSLLKMDRILAQISPVLLLPFIGYIIAAMSGPELGYRGLSSLILLANFPIFVFILWQSLHNLERNGTPLGLRPSYVIILAPVSVFGIAVYNIWSLDVFFIFWIGAVVTALLMAPFIGWLCEGGWSPGWGGFTFPLASFAGIMLLGVKAGFGVAAVVCAVIALGVASLVIPFVVWRTYRFWGQGKLAEATGAAVV